MATAPTVLPDSAAMLPFDVILFDVGGVLLSNGWDHNERAAAVEAFHLDRVEFERRHAEVYPAWERGDITIEAYLGFVVFHLPRSFSLDDFKGFMFGLSHILPDSAIGVLRELAADGRYLLGALNNEARETNKHRFETFHLNSHFDLALSSCYLGLRKPDQRIYDKAIDILGRKPDRVLFIDDREENIVPAKEIGMATVHYTGASQFRQELINLGVL